MVSSIGITALEYHMDTHTDMDAHTECEAHTNTECEEDVWGFYIDPAEINEFSPQHVTVRRMVVVPRLKPSPKYGLFNPEWWSLLKFLNLPNYTLTAKLYGICMEDCLKTFERRW